MSYIENYGKQISKTEMKEKYEAANNYQYQFSIILINEAILTHII